jgi:hypothetical protein
LVTVNFIGNLAGINPLAYFDGGEKSAYGGKFDGCKTSHLEHEICLLIGQQIW